jgi:hypothetical protein
MNVNRSHGPHANGASERYRDAMDAFVLRTRIRLAHARQIASRLAEIRQDHATPNVVERPANDVEHPAPANAGRAERKDRVDISEGLQTEAREAHNAGDEEILRPKMARLKHAYRMGKLFRQELFERAAHNMLRHGPNDGAPDVARPNVAQGPTHNMLRLGPNDGKPEVAPPNLAQGPTKPGSVKLASPLSFAPFTGDAPKNGGTPNTGDLPNTGDGGPNL